MYPSIAATLLAYTTLFRLKLDARLIPIVVLLYALSLIDRTNLAGARISGIDGALGLDLGNRYSVVCESHSRHTIRYRVVPKPFMYSNLSSTVSVFYVGYVFFELPSNIILKKLGAPLWLSILALLFGVVTLGIGFSRNYATLLALRILLGIFEAVSIHRKNRRVSTSNAGFDRVFSPRVSTFLVLGTLDMRSKNGMAIALPVLMEPLLIGS